MSDTPQSDSAAPRGWNGRRLAVAVGISVLMGALLFTYILWLYAEVERASAETTSAWRSVASELAPRYGRIEKLVAEGVDKRQVAMEVGEQFRLRIDAFRATGQAEEQVTEVLGIEELLGKIASSLDRRSLRPAIWRPAGMRAFGVPPSCKRLWNRITCEFANSRDGDRVLGVPFYWHSSNCPSRARFGLWRIYRIVEFSKVCRM